MLLRKPCDETLFLARVHELSKTTDRTTETFLHGEDFPLVCKAITESLIDRTPWTYA